MSEEHNYRNSDHPIIDNPIETFEAFEQLLEQNEPMDTSIEIEQQNGILVKPSAYIALAKHALKYGSHDMPQYARREVIGLLTGTIERQNTPLERIVVHKYWPIGIGDGVSVNILDAEPVMHVYQHMQRGHFIVGWAHSHPGYTPFMSTDDVETHLRYQALWEPSIALVIDPILITSRNLGFKIFRLTEDRQTYFELSFEVDGMTPSASYNVLAMINEHINTSDK